MLWAVIDRFEGDKAILLIGEREAKAVFPRRYLPEDIKEGDYLRLLLAYDPEMTRQAQLEAEALLAEVKKMNE